MSRTLTKNLVVASLLLGAPLSGARAAQSPQRERPLEVVTTLEVLASLVRAVGGEDVHAVALSDPRQDPHYVEPRPTLMSRTRDADAFVEVGLQLELWADKVVDGSGNPRVQRGQPGRVIASQGVAALELPAVLSREWGDVHPYGNPHVWLDPLNAVTMAETIAAALGKLDAPHAQRYADRLEAFRADVHARLFGQALVDEVGASRLARLARQGRLDEYLESRDLEGLLGGWLARARPLRGRPVVSYHKTFAYLAERFGFEVVAEIEEKPGIPPSARHRDELVELMRAKGVRTVAQCLFYDRAAADYLAEKTGAHVVTVAIDSGPQLGLDGYAALIDRLLDELLAAEGGG